MFINQLSDDIFSTLMNHHEALSSTWCIHALNSNISISDTVVNIARDSGGNIIANLSKNSLEDHPDLGKVLEQWAIKNIVDETPRKAIIIHHGASPNSPQTMLSMFDNYNSISINPPSLTASFATLFKMGKDKEEKGDVVIIPSPLIVLDDDTFPIYITKQGDLMDKVTKHFTKDTKVTS